MGNKGLLLGLGALLAGAILWSKRKPTEAAEGEGAVLDVAIYDDTGNRVMSRVEAWDPSIGGSLNEGGTYTLVFSVKNNSTRGGIAWPVSFDLYRATQLTGYAFPMEEFVNGVAFAAGETKTFSKSFTLPMGSGGASGYIKVQVFPAGALSPIVAESQKAFITGTLEIIYGATIVVNPI